MTVTNDRASTRKEAARQHLVIFRRNNDSNARYFVELGRRYGLDDKEIIEASGLSAATIDRLLS